MRMLSVAVLSVSLFACGGSTGGGGSSCPSSQPACPGYVANGVTSVSVGGPSSVGSYGSATLDAVVQGNGSFVPFVNWVINQGGGSLSATTGAQVVYTAPLVSVPTTVVIYAVSQSDSAKFGQIQMTVAPPPDPGTFFGGSIISGTASCKRTNDGVVLTATEQYTVTKIDATHVAIFDVFQDWGFNSSVPGADPNAVATLDSDGTLMLAYTCGISPYNQCVISGSGTWDFRGSLSFNANLSGFCTEQYSGLKQ